MPEKPRGLGQSRRESLFPAFAEPAPLPSQGQAPVNAGIRLITKTKIMIPGEPAQNVFGDGKASEKVIERFRMGEGWKKVIVQ